jgi:hypothetical protein
MYATGEDKQALTQLPGGLGFSLFLFCFLFLTFLRQGLTM